MQASAMTACGAGLGFYVDVFELRVAVSMFRAFDGLVGRLETMPESRKSLATVSVSAITEASTTPETWLKRVTACVACVACERGKLSKTVTIQRSARVAPHLRTP